MFPINERASISRFQSHLIHHMINEKELPLRQITKVGTIKDAMILKVKLEGEITLTKD